MLKVIISGEKEGISCSCAGCNPKIVLAHVPGPFGMLAGMEVNAHIGIDHQWMMNVDHHQALKSPLQYFAFALTPVVHLCKHTNLSQADNADQWSWLAVDQVVGAQNPLPYLPTADQVNNHAGIKKEQFVLGCL